MTVSCYGEGSWLYMDKDGTVRTKHKWMGLYASALAAEGRRLHEEWWEDLQILLGLSKICT